MSERIVLYPVKPKVPWLGILTSGLIGAGLVYYSVSKAPEILSAGKTAMEYALYPKRFEWVTGGKPTSVTSKYAKPTDKKGVFERVKFEVPTKELGAIKPIEFTIPEEIMGVKKGTKSKYADIPAIGEALPLTALPDIGYRGGDTVNENWTPDPEYIQIPTEEEYEAVTEAVKYFSKLLYENIDSQVKTYVEKHPDEDEAMIRDEITADAQMELTWEAMYEAPNGEKYYFNIIHEPRVWPDKMIVFTDRYAYVLDSYQDIVEEGMVTHPNDLDKYGFAKWISDPVYVQQSIVDKEVKVATEQLLTAIGPTPMEWIIDAVNNGTGGCEARDCYEYDRSILDPDLEINKAMGDTEEAENCLEYYELDTCYMFADFLKNFAKNRLNGTTPHLSDWWVDECGLHIDIHGDKTYTVPPDNLYDYWSNWITTWSTPMATPYYLEGDVCAAYAVVTPIMQVAMEKGKGYEPTLDLSEYGLEDEDEEDEEEEDEELDGPTEVQLAQDYKDANWIALQASEEMAVFFSNAKDDDSPEDANASDFMAAYDVGGIKGAADYVYNTLKRLDEDEVFDMFESWVQDPASDRVEAIVIAFDWGEGVMMYHVTDWVNDEGRPHDTITVDVMDLTRFIYDVLKGRNRVSINHEVDIRIKS